MRLADVMTGMRTRELYPANGGDDPKAAGPSVDQRFLATSKSLQRTPIASLQVSCDDRVDVAEVSTRRLSYSGASAPMAPYLVPHLTYERAFSALMPGGGAQAETLRRARAMRPELVRYKTGTKYGRMNWARSQQTVSWTVTVP